MASLVRRDDPPRASVEASAATVQHPRSAHRAALIRARQHTALAPTLIGVLGLVISLAGIGVPSIWYDEAATIISSTRSWAQLGDMIGNVDAVHALYYAMMHVIFDLVGYSPVSLRVPSAVAVGGAAALGVVLGRQLGSGRFAILAGLVFCLLPRTTWMGTEGRSYAITALLAVALTVVLIQAIRSGARRWWLFYACLVFVSCLVFIYVALIVVAHLVSVAWFWRRHRRDAWPAVRGWTVSAGASAIVLVPFGLLVMSESKQLHWLKPIGEKTLEQVLRDQWFFDNSLFAAAGWVLLVAGSAVLLLRGRVSSVTSRTPASGLSPAPTAASVLLPALLVPTLLLLLVTAVYLPIYTPRYLTMCLPFVALVMAAAIDRLRPRLVATVVVALLVALMVPTAIDQRQPEAKERSSWAAVADLIAEQRALDGPERTTAIIYGGVQYHPIATARVIAYSYPDAFEDIIDVALDVPAAETAALWETRYPLAGSLDRLNNADVTYLIASVARDIRTPTAQLIAPLGWHEVDAWELSKVHVVKYLRD